MEDCKQLRGSDFSVTLLGKVYDALRSRYSRGLEVNLSVLELTAEEMSHMVGITQRNTGTVNADAFRDCVNTIVSIHQSAAVSSDDDLMALRNKLKERKGTNA